MAQVAPGSPAQGVGKEEGKGHAADERGNAGVGSPTYHHAGQRHDRKTRLRQAGPRAIVPRAPRHAPSATAETSSFRQRSGGERTTLEPIHQRGDLRPLVHDQAFWLIPEGLPQLPSGVVGRSQNADLVALLTATRHSLTTTRTRLRFSDRANGVLGSHSRWEATRSVGK